MNLRKLEKWLDVVAFAAIIVTAVINAVVGNFAAMGGWIAAAMWVCVAAARRGECEMWRKIYSDEIGLEDER